MHGRSIKLVTSGPKIFHYPNTPIKNYSQCASHYNLAKLCCIYYHVLIGQEHQGKSLPAFPNFSLQIFMSAPVVCTTVTIQLHVKTDTAGSFRCSCNHPHAGNRKTCRLVVVNYVPSNLVKSPKLKM